MPLLKMGGGLYGDSCCHYDSNSRACVAGLTVHFSRPIAGPGSIAESGGSGCTIGGTPVSVDHGLSASRLGSCCCIRESRGAVVWNGITVLGLLVAEDGSKDPTAERSVSCGFPEATR